MALLALLISTWTALDGKMIERQSPPIIPLTVVLSRYPYYYRIAANSIRVNCLECENDSARPMCCCVDEAGSAGVRVAAGKRADLPAVPEPKTHPLHASRYLQWKYCGCDRPRLNNPSLASE
jgi:hypothetical protein